MAFFAHSKNKQGDSQLLTDHLLGVQKLAAQFAGAFGAPKTGAFLGLLHDLGKADPAFQDVLFKKGCHVNHSAAGAAVAYNLAEQSSPHPMLSDVLYSHHTELGHPDLDVLATRMFQKAGDAKDADGNTLTLFGQAALLNALQTLQLPLEPAEPAPLLYPKGMPKEEFTLRRMLWMRLLLSALVDADYSDTARHFTGQPVADAPLDVQAALDALTAKHDAIASGSTSASELNKLREQLYQDCSAAGEKAKGLYTLTAPTGMGKTLSLLAFALHHAKKHNLRRIVLILPYLSLMQQNVAVYRDIIPDLLESHSMAVWDEKTKLLAERWEAPMIVTTSVQFFESLFKSRAPDLRKLHQLAGSVVVFDEAQTLPAKLLTPTLRALKALRDLAGCTVVFSTATQPSYESLRTMEKLDWQAEEIVSDVPALYAATRRVTMHWRINTPITMEALAAEAATHPQCLLIVNLRRHAQALASHLQKSGVAPDSLFYMTTDLCPAHRTKVLDAIHDRLAAGLPCRVIATQCVEAGVDLDFPILYRALAPLESIIQAAGRCNRNGITPEGQVFIFKPDVEGKLYPDEWYGYCADHVEVLLSLHQGNLDIQDPAIIKAYYDACYNQGTPPNEALLSAISHGDFHITADEYRLIKNDQYHIVVPWAGREACNVETLLKEGLTPALMKQLQFCTVSTYDERLLDGCEQLPLRSLKPNEAPIKNPSRWYWLDLPAMYDANLVGLHPLDEPPLNLY